MSSVDLGFESEKGLPLPRREVEECARASKPLVPLTTKLRSLRAISKKSVSTAFLENEYRWEIVFVNDGSVDNTGQLAEAFFSQASGV